MLLQIKHLNNYSCFIKPNHPQPYNRYMNVTNEDKVRCPKCNSDQITANKKGFGVGKAIGGALLTGGVGLLAGTIGSGKIIITCLNCGHRFKPGQGKKPDLTIPVIAENKLSIEEAKQQHIAKRNAVQVSAITAEEKAEPISWAASMGCLAVVVIIVIIIAYFI